jgi:hypothetical protein
MTDVSQMSPLTRLEHMNDLSATLKQRAYEFAKQQEQFHIRQEAIRARLKELFHAAHDGALGIQDLLRVRYPWGEEYDTLQAIREVNRWFKDTGIFIMDTYWETNEDQQISLLINPEMTDIDLDRTADLLTAMMEFMRAGQFVECGPTVKGFMLPQDRDPYRLPYLLIHEGGMWKVVDEYYLILHENLAHKQPAHVSDTLLEALMYIRDNRPYRKELLRA